MSKVTVKGFFIRETIKYVKKRKGPEGVKQLEKKFGKSLKFFPFRDYPFEDDVKLQKAAVEVLNDMNTSAESFEIGKFTFSIYISTSIGKTMFKLMGDDPKKVAFNLVKVIDTVTKGLRAEVEGLGQDQVKIKMFDSPYNIRHYEGVFAAALEYLNYKPITKSKVLEDGTHEYIVGWGEKK